MTTKKAARGEVIMAGLGGRGVLLTGMVLGGAALSLYPHVTFYPSYAIAKRGGECECTVIFSEEEIASPMLLRTQAAIILEASQFRPFEQRVRPGGIMVVESTGLKEKPERPDVKVFPVPGLEIALGLGDTLVSNFVLLGVYMGLTEVFPSRFIEAELERRFAGRERALSLNMAAFRKGLELAHSLK